MAGSVRTVSLWLFGGIVMERAMERRARSPLSLVGQRAEDLIAGPAQGPYRDGFLATDVFETDSSFFVRAALPGVATEDLRITRVGDTLTLEGELRRVDPEGATYLSRERSFGRFSRALALPEGARNDVSATLENGVLCLEFAKPAPSVPRTIRVTVVQ
jgi:HSP20 family protein